MSDYATQDQLLLAKIQAAAGTEEAPDPATDAIIVSNLRYRPAQEVDQGENEHRGSLDTGTPIGLGGGAGYTFGVRWRGSGVGGTAPRHGRLLRMSGFSETVTAADVTGTAQAGSTTSITLEAGASAVDDFYKGMPIEATGGAGVGQPLNVIKSYNGATKEAELVRTLTTAYGPTTVYRIPANVLYRPVSNDLEVGTLWGYQNSNKSALQSRRRRVYDAMANFQLALGPRQIPQLDFTFSGVFPAAPDNVARPTGEVFDPTEPIPFIGAEALYHDTAMPLTSFRLNIGNDVRLPDDPAQDFGKGAAASTRRTAVLQITQRQTALSSFDFVADLVASDKKTAVMRWGKTAGNRVSLLFPDLMVNTSPEEADADGFAADSVSFRSVGADEPVWICAH